MFTFVSYFPSRCLFLFCLMCVLCAADLLLVCYLRYQQWWFCRLVERNAHNTKNKKWFFRATSGEEIRLCGSASGRGGSITVCYIKIKVQVYSKIVLWQPLALYCCGPWSEVNWCMSICAFVPNKTKSSSAHSRNVHLYRPRAEIDWWNYKNS